MSSSSDSVLIGLGSPYMSDEGVGVRLVNAAVSRGLVPEGVEALDLGVAGFGLLHAIAGRTKAVFIDCCFMGDPPGSLRRFTPKEVRTRKITPRQSLHEGDLLATLDLSRALGESPAETIIFGIQPASVEPGESLSPELESRFEEYLARILRELTGRAEPGDDVKAEPPRQGAESLSHS